MPAGRPLPPSPLDQDLVDEEGLDPTLLDRLGPPLRPSPVRLDEADEADEAEPVAATAALSSLLTALRAPQALPPGEALLSEEEDPERSVPALPGLDPALVMSNDEDPLTEAVPRLPVAAVEELVSLPDLDGYTVPATLATALSGVVLSGDLNVDADGVRGMSIGPYRLTEEDAARTWRLVLAGVELHSPFQLRAGPGPRLIIGGEVLAGHVLIDPGLRRRAPHSRTPRS